MVPGDHHHRDAGRARGNSAAVARVVVDIEQAVGEQQFGVESMRADRVASVHPRASPV